MRQDADVQGGVDLDDVRVVAVDPRAERRLVMRRLLEHSFRAEEIAEADSAAAAIELVGRCRPDVVVLEIQMPLEVGLDTIETLDRMSPRPRIVVCSFRHDAATVRAALDRGADAYVAKPAGSAELRVALAVAAGRAGRPAPTAERAPGVAIPAPHTGAHRRNNGHVSELPLSAPEPPRPTGDSAWWTGRSRATCSPRPSRRSRPPPGLAALGPGRGRRNAEDVVLGA